jgi:hypothetical protein
MKKYWNFILCSLHLSNAHFFQESFINSAILNQNAIFGTIFWFFWVYHRALFGPIDLVEVFLAQSYSLALRF